MKVSFSAPVPPQKGLYVVFAFTDAKLGPSGRALDEATGGAIQRAISASRFKGKPKEHLSILAPAGTGIERVCLIGLGNPKSIDETAAQEAGGTLYATLARSVFDTAVIAVGKVEGAKMSATDFAAELAFGAKLRSYRFDKYLTKEKKEDKPSLKAIDIRVANPAAAKKRFDALEKIADGVFFTRDLVSEPANIIYPETLAKQAESLRQLGVKVEVLGEREMTKLGMGALLGVGQGSERESKLVVMQWLGAGKSKAKKGKAAKSKPIAFVGKGVTFDTGGISIKPAAGMEDMKWDMGGAGVVIGLMKALAGRKAKVDAVGIVGLVENMPDGNAQRPGDIVTSMSGQTIEVLNTDAEGRLVLADALWYCKNRFDPRFIVDLATLTGAIIIALGNEKAGLFATDDALAKRIEQAGEKVKEHVWRMPLGDEYDKMLKSDAADMKNISGGRGAGSITAAQFLKRFVDKTPWAHLDIAGVAWSSKDAPTVPKGGTGFGVRLLDRLIADHYEGR